jgi:hypothetical protein
MIALCLKYAHYVIIFMASNLNILKLNLLELSLNRGFLSLFFKFFNINFLFLKYN